MDVETGHGRIYWRSRRGLLELELLLIPFARDCFAGLRDDEQDSYVRLLEHDDLDIYDWIQDRCEPEDQSLRAIVARIRQHNSPDH